MLRADARLNSDYAEAVKRLSAADATNLKADQLQWLRFIDAACPAASNSSLDAEALAQKDCLGQAYAGRDLELTKAYLELGPYRFARRDHYTARPVRDLCQRDESDRIEQDRLSFPQIDRPADERTQRWNKAVAEEAQRLYGEPNAVVDSLSYEMGFSNDRMISLTWSRSYCNGTRGSGSESILYVVVFAPNLHTLSAADIFRPGAKWADRLRKLTAEAMRRSQSGGTDGVDYAALARVVTEPARWEITKDGLAVRIGFNEFGLCRACTLGIVLPWPALRDVMVDHPPVF